MLQCQRPLFGSQEYEKMMKDWDRGKPVRGKSRAAIEADAAAAAARRRLEQEAIEAKRRQREELLSRKSHVADLNEYKVLHSSSSRIRLTIRRVWSCNEGRC